MQIPCTSDYNAKRLQDCAVLLGYMISFDPIFTNDGYRPNVGIIICNRKGEVFWARRINDDGWQFPQGGVGRNEGLIDAMYRELEEETGLASDQVKIVAHTKQWLTYDLPPRLLRNQRRRSPTGTRSGRGGKNSKNSNGAKDSEKRVSFKGQKQVWFLVELIGDDSMVDLKAGPEQPEFDDWRWVDREHAISNIVDFKRVVYQQAMNELEPFLPNG